MRPLRVYRGGVFLLSNAATSEPQGRELGPTHSGWPLTTAHSTRWSWAPHHRPPTPLVLGPSPPPPNPQVLVPHHRPPNPLVLGPSPPPPQPTGPGPLTTAHPTRWFGGRQRRPIDLPLAGEGSQSEPQRDGRQRRPKISPSGRDGARRAPIVRASTASLPRTEGTDEHLNWPSTPAVWAQ